METGKKNIDIVYKARSPSENPLAPHALSISEGEMIAIKARQRKVSAALQKLGVEATKDKEPPIIAVLGSGGGLRAMVSLLGTLSELAKEDLLDVITYICGTSGSTWCMASLYNNDKWSSCMAEMESQMSDCLMKSAWDKNKAWEKLQESISSGIYSLTNFWAYVVVYKVTNKLYETTLSDQRAACESGENPYPVYSAVEKRHLNKNEPGAWFEFTPHLAGFPAYKSFVNTELLGSQFKGGELLKNYPEKDLCYLQGLWGSAPSSEDVMQKVIKSMIQKISPTSNASTSEDLLCSCSGCAKLLILLSHELADMTPEKIEQFCNEIATALADTYGGSCETVKVVSSVLQTFMEWIWGTTNNFLYEWKSDVPEDIYSKEFLNLVDAGLEINCAYPLMLPPNRKVDLILSFDYSDGNPFLTLQATAEYCKINGIPFPKVNIDDKEIETPSKCCYVFEGGDNGAPDVMHFPLFNNQNAEGKVRELREKYPTSNLSYDESELKEILQLSKLNVQLSKPQILEKMQQCIDRK
ncbi:cytosolic phospholipase A2 gamma isoform X2 [Pseudophryne corroboree]|uniref:cytosolic phospholipase A2 gamma isoform X2 n=1 Tax=Pseudophryne corroboree TaxID=495146 RepID=UPI0030812CC6